MVWFGYFFLHQTTEHSSFLLTQNPLEPQPSFQWKISWIFSLFPAWILLFEAIVSKKFVVLKSLIEISNSSYFYYYDDFLKWIFIHMTKKESISSKLPRRWIFILGKEVHFIYYEWRASNVTQTILNIGTFDVSSMVGNVHSNKNTISHDPWHWPAASEHNIFTMFILAELASCNWILWPVSWPEKRTSLSLLSFRDQKWW